MGLPLFVRFGVPTVKHTRNLQIIPVGNSPSEVEQSVTYVSYAVSYTQKTGNVPTLHIITLQTENIHLFTDTFPIRIGLGKVIHGDLLS
ncbi:MAG: hypothetical protein BWY95_02269 [Bacteroidetes bacterium ADurb.BinA104]|nr:MAG: hypothetical protein BWY95_02269 [Bacteroidetes bacterium ADurb.BinA104]